MTDWKKNVLVYKIDSFLNWFYVPIGVWVLIWNHFFSFSQISLSMGISLLAGVACELPSGALADMIGRKRTVMLGRLILFLGYVWLFFRHDFVGFLVWQIAYQIDGAFTSGANSALLYDSLKENGQVEKHYKKVEADTFMYNTIGMAVGGIFGGLLYEITPMGPYNFMILVTGLGLLASCFYQEPAMEKIGWSVKSYLKQNYDGFMHIFSNEKIKAVSLFSIAVSVVTYTGLWYLYEPRLTAGGFDPKILAILISGTYAIRAVGTRFNPTPLVMAISQTVGTALSFAGGKFGAVSSVYLRKFVDGCRQPSLIAWQNDQIESKYRATSLSAISLLTNLIVGGVGPLLGVGIDRFGAETTLGIWTIFGVVVVIPLGWRLGVIMKNKT
ncbi:MAG: MFS transporter [Candidatus Shapirobacteria bacterium]|jgi:MFS family permease